MAAGIRREAVLRCVRAGAVVPLAIDGVRRQYFIGADDFETLRRLERTARSETVSGPEDRTCFLAPLDNLLWRRNRIADLFQFGYTWEVYLPLPKRRYGHYAMPILSGDRLIGRIDPQLDRARRRLVIRLLQLEPNVRATGRLRTALRSALESFARFHGVTDLRAERTIPPGLRL